MSARTRRPKEAATAAGDAPTRRVFVPADLIAGAVVPIEAGQAHHLGQVLRLGTGDEVSAFNGRDGEWRARIDSLSKAGGRLAIGDAIRAQDPDPDLWLAFAPIKRARIDFLVEKASELGVTRLLPVLTRRTAVRKVNHERLLAHAVGAAEQCGRLSVPALDPARSLDEVLGAWPTGRRLLVLDESGGGIPIVEAVGALLPDPGPCAFLSGPEGGFDPTELDGLGDLPFVTAVGLGPRLLRADTAALAALACWQALAGDWRGP